MTLGEKIQKLRKIKGISQEELANALNVSRQALSKWECGTSLPDIDKVVTLSEYFHVSTDYLLKDDITPGPENSHAAVQAERNLDGISIIVSTALVLIGLILAWVISNDGTLFIWWSAVSAAPGMIVQIAGLTLLYVLYFLKKSTKKSLYLFWKINTWFLTVMPIIFLMGFLTRIGIKNNMAPTLMFMVFAYLTINGLITLVLLFCSHKQRKK